MNRSRLLFFTQGAETEIWIIRTCKFPISAQPGCDWMRWLPIYHPAVAGSVAYRISYKSNVYYSALITINSNLVAVILHRWPDKVILLEILHVLCIWEWRSGDVLHISCTRSRFTCLSPREAHINAQRSFNSRVAMVFSHTQVATGDGGAGKLPPACL